jgi:multidrug transporter EmrE-like cation transporter
MTYLARLVFVATGFVMLGCYGVVVNTVKWDFSKLLGVYVAVFAPVSVLSGTFRFKEQIPVPAWIGIACICVGASFIQFGNSRL